MGRNYFIKLPDSTKVSVSEEEYRAYKRPQWREKYHEEKEKELHISYDELIESKYQLKEHHFTSVASAEEFAGDVILLEKLRSAIDELETDERKLVEALYYKQKSEREYSKSSGVPRQTIARRRRKILEKLRKLMEDKNTGKFKKSKNY